MPHGVADAFLHDAISRFLCAAVQPQPESDPAFKANLRVAALPESDQIVDCGFQPEIQAAHWSQLAQDELHMALDVQGGLPDGAGALARLAVA